MSEQITADISDLAARFPGKVKADERKGYEGFLVAAKDLPAVAVDLRDEMGYDFLSSVTAVDYIDDGLIEVVYHFFKSTGGTALTLSVQVPRDKAEVPTLSLEFPSMDLQEREVFDMYGVTFTGHPDLRRVLMWDGFEGYPPPERLQRSFLYC